LSTDTGKNIVITGANSGIGYEAALHFAKKGENVIMACRNPEKAAKAEQQIRDQLSNAKTTVMALDVSSLESITNFANQLAAQIDKLDVLVNNAGVAAIAFARNDKGHEMQLATNYLGAFALTGLLLPLLSKSDLPRIVNVGSLMHRMGKLELEDFNWENTPYDPWKSYGRSKLAMMSHTVELNRRLQTAGSAIIALGAHPGFANTNIHANSPSIKERSSSEGWLAKKKESLIPLADMAAKPIIFAAESETAKGGDYYGPGGLFETGIGGRGPRKATIKRIAKNRELAQQLWDISEKMSGVSYLDQQK